MLHHRDDLTCDLAEYYGIENMDGLSVETLATLSCGLPAESRTMMRRSGQKVSTEIMLLAVIADRLGILVWHNTEDGKKGRNPPESILSGLTEQKEEDNLVKFSTGADFEAARAKLLEKGETSWQQK